MRHDDDDTRSAEDSDGDAPFRDDGHVRTARRPHHVSGGPAACVLRLPAARGAGALARLAELRAGLLGGHQVRRRHRHRARREDLLVRARWRAARRPGGGHRADDAQPGPAAAHAAAEPGGARVHAEGDQGDGAAHPRGRAADRRPPARQRRRHRLRPELRGRAPARGDRRAARRARTRTATRSSSGRTGSSATPTPSTTRARRKRRMEASMELYMYAQSLADDRRARPMDDIVTTLITAELDGEKLSDIEFNVFVLLLSVAGNETTRNLISGGMLALMENPDQQERLARRRRPARSTRSSTRCSATSARSCTSGAPSIADTELRGVPIAGRREDHGLVRRREPRRGRLHRPAHVRRDALTERAHRVRWPRPALLPRHRAREDGDQDDVRGDADAGAGHAPRR